MAGFDRVLGFDKRIGDSSHSIIVAAASGFENLRGVFFFFSRLSLKE